MKILVLTTLVSLALTCQAVGAEMLELRYEMTSTVIAENTKKPDLKSSEKNSAESVAEKSSEKSGGLGESKKVEKSVQSGPMTVILGIDRYTVATERGSVLYDFKKKRYRSSKKKASTYTDSSLYAIAGFRDIELKNRAMLATLLSKAGVASKASPFDPFDVACELGMVLPGKSDDPGITTEDDGNKVRFIRDGQTVTEAELSDSEPGRFGPMYRKFLLYDCRLHPSIRKELLSRGRILKSLTFVAPKLKNRERVELRLASRKTLDGEPGLPADLKRAFDSSNPIYRLQEKLLCSDSPPEPPSKKEAYDRSQMLVDMGKKVDGFLTMMEYCLCTGDYATPEMKELVPRIGEDETVRKIMANLRPGSKKQAEESLKQLSSIDSEKLDKGYLIEIFKGDIASSLGKQADKMFLKALTANPLIAGAYKDLGSYYYSRYETILAWDCWDLLRFLAPGHPFVEDVVGVEKSLENSHPEYFILDESAD